jgi:homogentisate 1,2-dioxygenase
MIDRIAAGRLPRKHHVVFRDEEGRLLHEECLTREGFDGPYTILYHRHRPHEQRAAEAAHGWRPPAAAEARPLRKRHYRTGSIPAGGAPVNARIPLLFNEDVTLAVLRPNAEDPVYFANGDGDDLFFVREGGGVLRTSLGDVRFEQHDYVFVPRGLVHRFLPDAGPQHWLSLEWAGGMHLPKQFRNEAGQLRMDAPYSHRDFRRPEFRGPVDEGIRQLVVKRGNAFHGFALEHSPLDVVGWDGTVYPWAFPIRNFQPRVSSVHLPPTWHGTFAARGALVCSFVPRPVDFDPEAIPCPYPHSSVDCDEFLFYASGNFTSRKGIGPGSVSFHPAGIPHGPHPGAYEASIGTRSTEELAVMVDTFKPLRATRDALGLEDPDYMESFLG